MSDNAQLARTGAGLGGTLVIGTTAITGGWILAIAVTLILIGALAIRFTFRTGRSADQR